jgi:acyl-CoA dehydrogenase
MLVECLSIGRSITLPSTASGGAKMAAVVTGAYARIRKQFGLSVGRFEGVEEALARIGRQCLCGQCAVAGHRGRGRARRELPAVPSTIAKYHCTEMGRAVRRRRHGHPRRQGHHPRPEELPRPRLAGARRSRSPSRAPTS